MASSWLADPDPSPSNTPQPLPHSPPPNHRQRARPGRQPGSDSSSTRIRYRYQSALTETEVGQAATTRDGESRHLKPERPGLRVRWRSQVEIHEVERQSEENAEPETSPTRTTTEFHLSRSPAGAVSRLSFLAVVLAIMVPVLHMTPLLHTGPAFMGAEAGPINPSSARRHDLESSVLLSRRVMLDPLAFGGRISLP